MTLSPSAPAVGGSHLSDFDGDGRADIAVVGGGTVTVQYASGQTQEITPTSLATSVPFFGDAAAADDVNGDGFTDLALGAPVDHECDESCPPQLAGEAFILFGSRTGLRTDNRIRLTSPFPAASENGSFGRSVALLRTPAPVLVVGEPLVTVAGQRQAGVVHLYPLSPAGVPGSRRTVSQNTRGVPGVAEFGDNFGAEVVAAGPHLVVSVDAESVGTLQHAGMLTVFRFSSPSAFTAWGYTQNSPGVPGTAEAEDRFGGHLAIDGTLAVSGIPAESVGTRPEAGMIQPFTLTATGAVFGRPLTQNSPGVPGIAERGDLFGERVAILRGCGGKPAFAVESGGETVGSVRFAGMAFLIPTAPTAACPVVSYVTGRAPLYGALAQVGQPRVQGVVRTSTTGSDTLYLATIDSVTAQGIQRLFALNSPYTSVATSQITLDFGAHIVPPAP